jgi:hypothetical protein
MTEFRRKVFIMDVQSFVDDLLDKIAAKQLFPTEVQLCFKMSGNPNATLTADIHVYPPEEKRPTPLAIINVFLNEET